MEENPFKVLHVFGKAYDRGYAYGSLMADDLMRFIDVDLQEFYKDEVDQIPLDDLPKWLQDIIKDPLKLAAPEVFDLALAYVYERQKEHIASSPANVWDEADGIVEGMCSVKKCDAASYKKKIRHVNMLPELIRMQCSMMGAWGKATPNDEKLVQLRTLDFGTGPFANVTFLHVSHPEEENSVPFASLSFPGFVGLVTGFSKYVGQCEKVDDVTGKKRPRGTYDGQAVSMVIRDMLQFSETKENAIEIAKNAKRTWSVWLGVGDTKSQEFDAILYDMEEARVLNDTTLPALTNQSYFEDVAYIDKHPQPSSSDDTMTDLVKQYYGNLSASNVVQNFPRLMQSGDVHVAAYDMGTRVAYVSRGMTDSKGQFLRYAYEAPFLSFDMDMLWNEKKRTAVE